ncbi:MAG: sugar kinase [Firmicutes bacterium]|nr:sugar kinase [Bacillota bacterium]
MGHVLSIGEMMVQMCPTLEGPLRQARAYERYVAGSEGNTLVSLELLGVKTRFISRVGDDELGSAILSELRARGIDVSWIARDKDAPTGVYFIQRGYPLQGKTTVLYYRKGSAASRLSPQDLSEEVMDDVKLVFMTGITPALSPSCNEACLKLMEMARSHDRPLAFDTNIRIKLLPDRAYGQKLLLPFLKEAKYIFTGAGDLTYLFGPGEIEEQIVQLRDLAPKADIILVKLGKHGAVVYEQDKVFRHQGYQVKVVDELGAGDAFSGAFIASMLRGDTVEHALRYANAAGALTVTAKGDLEPLPTWNDLSLFLSYYEDSEAQLLR